MPKKECGIPGGAAPVDHVRCSVQDGGAVLLDLKEGLYYSLNGVGARIWQGLQAGKLPAEISRELQSEHELPRERAETDVTRFVRSLEAKGLLHVSS